jgi:hypothetical protein
LQIVSDQNVPIKCSPAQSLETSDRKKRLGAHRGADLISDALPFIRAHNETLSVAAMRVNNPDCSPAGIHG